MGYGVVQKVDQQLTVLQCGVIQLHRYAAHALKLQKIFQRIQGLVQEFRPDAVVLEAPFYGKNVQSMLKLGRAQGVAMAAALAMEVPITEYAPRKIKQVVTGRGDASKEQVARMLVQLLQLEDTPTYFDASDALAVAVCHAWQKETFSGTTNNWKKFVQANPDRIVD